MEGGEPDSGYRGGDRRGAGDHGSAATGDPAGLDEPDVGQRQCPDLTAKIVESAADDLVVGRRPCCCCSFMAGLLGAKGLGQLRPAAVQARLDRSCGVWVSWAIRSMLRSAM
jgi:hypothetical protein